MSVEIVEAVRVKYPTPLGAEHGACLIAIAQALGGGAGLLKKDWGTFVRLPDGTAVAQDIICYPNGRIFDCLADGEGAAVPAWSEAYGSPISDLSRYYAVSAAPVPPPVPEAPKPPVRDSETPVRDSETCKALDAMAEVLDAIRELRLEQAEQYDALRSQLARLEDANRLPRKVQIGRWSGVGQVSGIDESQGEK